MSTTAIPTGEEPQVDAEAKEPPVAETATARKIFRYSQFVDIGDGADTCEHARDGQCEDPAHFHAWCRLPNRYQEDDIRAKAMAAKARRIRGFNDPESDLAVVLAAEMEPLDDPHFQETLVDELVGDTLTDDYIEAQADVREQEEFAHIEQDQEEYERLRQQEGELAEEEQSEEFRQLTKQVQAYLRAIPERLREIQEPRRVELRARPYDKILAEVRARRVEAEGARAFMDTYTGWTCYVGTFSPELHQTLRRPHKPKWEDIGHRDRPEAGTMYGEDPDVVQALSEVFTDLRTAFRAGSKGN